MAEQKIIAESFLENGPPGWPRNVFPGRFWSTANALMLGLYLILVACAAYLWGKWDSIPQRFPIHWGLSGDPNGWATKSFLGVYMMLIIAAVTGTFIFAMARLTKSAERALASGASVSTGGQGSSFMELLTIGIAYIAVVPMALFSVWLPFRGLEESPMVFILSILTVAAVLQAVGLVVFFKLRGREENAPSATRKDRGGAVDHTQACHWKWGLFYYNPDDPARWVEKRLGFGPTPNMAHKGSWWGVGAVVAYLVFLVSCAVFMTQT